MMTTLDLSDAELVAVRSILAAHVPGSKVLVFGSRASASAKPYSDLDLAIIAEHALTPRQLAGLELAFEESELRFRVDVVDWATLAPGFRAIIENTGVELVSPAKSQ